MSASQQDKVLVACPRCGHQQPEPRGAFSTVCKKCRGHFRLQEVPNPVRKTVEPAYAQRRIKCSHCGSELEVAVSAESTMCKRCGHHIDLRDYHISNAISKNFKTEGLFVVEPKGGMR